MLEVVKGVTAHYPASALCPVLSAPGVCLEVFVTGSSVKRTLVKIHMLNVCKFSFIF